MIMEGRRAPYSASLYPDTVGSTGGAARLALQRLLLLRMLTTLTGAAAVFILQLVSPAAFPVEIPTLLLSCLIAAIFSSIILGFWRLRQSRAITVPELFLHLMVDVFFLVLTLLYTGGASNPLISYLLVLLAVGATLLTRFYVNLFAIISIVVYTFFLVRELQANRASDNAMMDYQLHIVGMWVIFVVSAVLITAFVTRMAEAIRARELTLAKVRENEMRNEQLVAIGTLAAGTAHALGTPLSTMSVLLTDLDRESEESLRQKPIKADISLLRQQVTRCKESLNNLTRFYNKSTNVAPDSLALSEFVSDIRDYVTNIHPGSRIDFKVDPEFERATAAGSGNLSDPSLKHAVINIVENAIKAARSKVVVEFIPDSNEEAWLEIAVQDDGPGIPVQVMERMGEPFISTREDSMGLGIFLANAAVERSGGSIEVFNLKTGGARTLIRLPKDKRPEL